MQPACYDARMKIIKLATILFALVLCYSVVGSSAEQASEKIRVVVSIPPFAKFVQEIARELAETQVMVPPGANPHIYEPTPAQLQYLERAQLYIATGTGIEFEIAWLSKLKDINKNVHFVNGSDGIDLIQPLNQEGAGRHHENVAGDPHVWLSPKNAITIVRNIEKALNSVDPENQNFYAENAQNFEQELKALDETIRTQLSQLSGRSFLVYHPAWGYFAHEYNLSEVSIEMDGKEPSARYLAEVIELSNDNNIRAVVISPQFSQKSAQMIASEIGAEIIHANELSEDYIESLRNFSDHLSRVLSDESR